MIYLNKKRINFGQFPNGETYIEPKQVQEAIDKAISMSHKIFVKFEDDRDLIRLMFLKKHLDNYGLKYVYLTINYFPYSRMDRTIGRTEDDSGSIFTLKHVAEFINDLNFSEVHIVDPHSDVTPALLDRCFVKSAVSELIECATYIECMMEENAYVYFPDATAYKRYSKEFPKWKHLIGLKHRDFETGNIESLKVIYDEKPKRNFDVIMVDDLCSRGGTLMEGAKALKQLGADNIIAVIAHCEDNIHNGEILTTEYINKVYTTDTILTKYHEKLEVTSI